MKKTLIITLEFPPTIGGIATYVHELATALDPSQTIVLAPEHPDAAAWDQQQSYTIVRKKLLFPRWVWPRWLRLVLHVRRLVRQQAVERILVHHVLPVGYAAVLMRRWFHVPFLIFSHGTDVQIVATRPRKKALLQRVAERADGIIFNSESLRRRFLQLFPAFDQKSGVMYPAPAARFLDAADPGTVARLTDQLALNGKVVLLSVGRMTDGKGFPHMVRLLPAFLKVVPHLAWVVVGDGPKREQIMKQVQDAGMQSIVRFVGPQPQEVLKQYYDIADIFMLLTHPDEGREEGLGLVFLEAAAAGVPVIAGRSGGVAEAVSDGETGIVVDLYKGDQHIVDAVQRLATDQAYAAQLAAQARQRVETVFTWNTQLNKIRPWLGDGGASV